MKGKKTSAEVRIMITKKFLKGSSVKELAGIYGISEPTVIGYLRNHINVHGRVIIKPPAQSMELQLPKEKWKPISIRTVTLYEASSLGRIKSHTFGKPKIITGQCKFGYRSINYQIKGSNRKQEYAHILIAMAWHGMRPSMKHVVVHLDHNKWNNKPSNLKWVTRKMAQELSRQSPYAAMLVKRIKTMPDEKRRNARYGKLTRTDVKQIKIKLHNGKRSSDVAKEYHIAAMTATRIHRGLIWADVMPQLTRKKKVVKVVPTTTRIAIINALLAGTQGKVIAKMHGIDPASVSRFKKQMLLTNQKVKDETE